MAYGAGSGEKKRGACWVLALMLGLCGGAGSSPALCAEKTTLTFLTWKPALPKPWEKLVLQFEKDNPGLQVRLQFGPQSSTDLHAVVAQRLKNRDPSVDIFFMDVTWPSEFASAGWLLDLTDRFTMSERRSFLEAPVASNTYCGRVYGIPLFMDGGLLFYRRDLLLKHSLPPPSTWEEMLILGKRILLAENNPGLHTYSGQFKQYEGLVCNMLEFIWSHGGDVLETSTGRVTLGEPSAVKAVAFVRDRIIAEAVSPGALSYEEPESLHLFLQGKAIFHRNWPYAWVVAQDPQASKVAGRVGVQKLPAFEGYESASALGGWQLGINRWSGHPEAAWRLIRHLTSSESQKTLALEAGRAPTRKALYQDLELRSKMPHLAMFLPAFERARTRPLTPLYPMISQELQRFFSTAISDPSSHIASLAKAAAQRIRKTMRLSETLRNTRTP